MSASLRLPVAALAAFCLVAPSAAPAQDAMTSAAPKPPGTVVQTMTVYLGGEAMNEKYMAIVSKKAVAPVSGQSVYQTYLSIYGPGANGNALVYQSPSANDPLGLVPPVAMYQGKPIPASTADVKLAGSGELTTPGVQQLVVMVHKNGADCGGAYVNVLQAGPQGNGIVNLVQATNPCALNATVVNKNVRLTGPYYAKSAPLYKPTKNNATATLSYKGGNWSLTPGYFKMTVKPTKSQAQ